MPLEPYFDDGQIQIWHGEALDVLRSLPARSVAAVVADPPYSSGGMFRSDRQADPSAKYRGWSQNDDGSSRKPTNNPGSFSGDSRDQHGYAFWSALWMSQACRVSAASGQVYIFTDWRQLPVTSDAVQAGGFVWRGLLVWDKGIGRPMKGRFRNHLEYIVWGSNGPMPDADENPVYPSTLLRYAPPGLDRLHVTQKPESLVRELLCTAPVGTVLDPFMGSGTTLRAAKDLGRRAIGIEIEERYCEIAATRLQQQVLPLGVA
jgi:site-specific DNA-methyltransferase (adenine-specific)